MIERIIFWSMIGIIVFTMIGLSYFTYRSITRDPPCGYFCQRQHRLERTLDELKQELYEKQHPRQGTFS